MTENTEDQILRFKLDNQEWIWDGQCDPIQDLSNYVDRAPFGSDYVVHESGCDGLQSVEWLIEELSINPHRADQFCVFMFNCDEDSQSEEIEKYNKELYHNC